MQKLGRIIFLGALVLMGCARKQGTFPPQRPNSPLLSAPAKKIIVTPETGLLGKVVKVNPEGAFVVLNFPIGHLPAGEQRLNVYRLGLKVGEIRVTGPQQDDNVVADIVAGEAREGDDVRDR